MSKVVVLKIEELQNAMMPENIMEGEKFVGVELDKPEINRRYNVYGVGGISTSPVQEIISESVFKTCNSIYRIYRIREVLIERIKK